MKPSETYHAIETRYCPVPRNHPANPFSQPENQPKLSELTTPLDLSWGVVSSGQNVGKLQQPGPWIDLNFHGIHTYPEVEDAQRIGSQVYVIEVSPEWYGRLVLPVNNSRWFDRIETFFDSTGAIFGDPDAPELLATKPPCRYRMNSIRNVVYKTISGETPQRYEAMRIAANAIRRKVKARFNYLLSKKKQYWSTNFDCEDRMAEVMSLAGIIYANNDLMFDPFILTEIAHDADLILKGYMPVGPFELKHISHFN